MNVQLKDVVVTGRDGRVSHLEQVYVRGSHVRLFVIPDMLKHAPMFRPQTLAKTRAQNATGRVSRGGFRGGRRR
jgi:small nuclear ribonucleoprotein D3